jgi:hypothetical protein
MCAVGALSLLTVLGPATTAVRAQDVRVAVPEENLRVEPRGTVLATILEGVVVPVTRSEGSWSLVTVEGWVWSSSVTSTSRDGFDLLVTKPGGENLRETASGSGRRIAILKRGMLLENVAREGSWIRVRRTAWMWANSLRQTSGQPAVAPAEPQTVQTQTPRLSDRIVVSDAPIELLASPDGDTVAVASPGADLMVLSRQGNWARVRLDSWVWVPATLPLDSVAPSAELSASDLQANPAQFTGRTVQWSVQFVSLEQAEEVRTDFYPGEPFILARAPDPDRGFIYVAVPPEFVSEVQLLRPLQRIDIVARVRTGRSALMGRPVLDLVGLN